MEEFRGLLSLGPIGTVLYTLVVLSLAVITWRQRNWRTAAETAGSSRDAALAEMSVHKETVGRIREENHDLRNELAKLKTLTDLAPLIAAQQANTDLLRQWISEGRDRFDEARGVLQGNTTALTAMVEEIKAQRRTSEDAYRNLTSAFMAHTLEDKQTALDSTQAQVRLASAIEELDRRMAMMAVQVGVVSWKEKPPPPSTKKRAESPQQ